jgi:hypothetical protein
MRELFLKRIVLIVLILSTGLESYGVKNPKSEKTCASILETVVNRRTALGLGLLGLTGVGAYFLSASSSAPVIIVSEDHHNLKSKNFKKELMEKAKKGEIFVALENSFFDDKLPANVFGIEGSRFSHALASAVFARNISSNFINKKISDEDKHMWVRLMFSTNGDYPKSFSNIRDKNNYKNIPAFENHMEKLGVTESDIQTMLKTIDGYVTQKSIKFDNDKDPRIALLITYAVSWKMLEEAVATQKTHQIPNDLLSSLEQFLIEPNMKDFKKLAIFWRNEIFSQNLIPIYERAQKENKPLYIVVGAYHAEDLQARLKNTLKKAPISITKSNK